MAAYNRILYSLKNITQVYGKRTVLDKITVSIRQNSFIGLAGPNGSGKSTLLRILAFLEPPHAGSIFFDGRPVNGRLHRIRKKVTLLAQEPYLLKRSVESNVAYGLTVRKEKQAEEKINDALRMVGLAPEPFRKRSWDALSGGEAQRVALAARLVFKPSVLLLDEPTTSLDAESTHRIKKAAVRVQKNWGTTVVVASHDIRWLEMVCDTIIELDEGTLRTSPSTHPSPLI